LNQASSSQKAGLRFDPFILVGFFICFYAFALALAPAVRTHQAAFQLDLSIFEPFLGWLAGILTLKFCIKKRLPNADPWLLSIMSALTGWGLLTVWRLSPNLGQKR